MNGRKLSPEKNKKSYLKSMSNNAIKPASESGTSSVGDTIRGQDEGGSQKDKRWRGENDNKRGLLY